MTFVLYLCRKFAGVCAAALLFFAMVLGLVDLFLNLWRYISESVPPSVILRISLLYVPKTVSFALPLAVLFGAAYVLSDLYAKNELTVIFASGVSLLNFTAPLLLISVFLSLALFAFDDSVVVPTYHRKMELQNEVLKTSQNLNNSNVVVISDGGRTVYKADFYDALAQTLYGLFIVRRDANMELEMVLRAQSAVWNGNHWSFQNYVCYNVAGRNITVSPSYGDVVFAELPDAFARLNVAIDELSVAEAKRQIAYLKRAGLPYAEALSVYYQKFSFPFILFIVVFLSVGLSGKTQKNVLLVSLLLCVGAAVTYYVAQMVTMLLARFEYISPLAGAWLPVFLYIILSCVLLRYTRT